MEKDLYNLINEFQKLNEERYKLLKPQVEYIIKNKIKDEHKIAALLDSLLDIITFSHNNKVILTYMKLCLYYYNINPEHAEDYYHYYLELLTENNENTKTKMP